MTRQTTLTKVSIYFENIGTLSGVTLQYNKVDLLIQSGVDKVITPILRRSLIKNYLKFFDASTTVETQNS